VVTLAALARRVPDLRLGTLVLCEALRPAAVLAKALATLDRICGGRLDVGLGAGWYEPEYDAIGMAMPAPPVRLERLTEAVEVVKGLLGGASFTFEGAHHRANAATSLPPAQQQPRPRVFVGGKGDRLLRLVARHADGWNTCWTWTIDAYRERLQVLERECERVDRDRDGSAARHRLERVARRLFDRRGRGAREVEECLRRVESQSCKRAGCERARRPLHRFPRKTETPAQEGVDLDIRLRDRRALALGPGARDQHNDKQSLQKLRKSPRSRTQLFETSAFGSIATGVK